MTFEELLKACSSGQMPRVTALKKYKSFVNPGDTGVVTVIKNNRNAKGCAVQFDHMDYDEWYWDSDSTDARTKYMRDLELQ